MQATSPGAVRCEARTDLAAVRANVRSLRTLLRPGVDVMAVVKAEGYGHGALSVARAALDAGAGSLGVATPAEALALRAAGVTAPLLAWLWLPTEDPGPALRSGVELAVSSTEHLDAVLAAHTGPPAAVQLKIDTGLGRNGVGPAELGVLVDALAAAVRAGRVRLTGTLSHLASADVPGDRSVGEQARAFAAALDRLREAGLDPGVRHLAATAGTVLDPALHHDRVRIGIGLYGFDPLAGTGAAGPSLRPAMTLAASVALVKRVPAGHGVSYGLTYRTPRETTLALVPLGYADGIPRAASNAAEVLLGGRRRRIAGRVAMDQFVVDCGDDPVRIGDEVLLFGPGDAGEPTATEWAQACGTIDYEIVTRIGPRVPRRHDRPGATAAERDDAAGERR